MFRYVKTVCRELIIPSGAQPLLVLCVVLLCAQPAVSQKADRTIKKTIHVDATSGTGGLKDEEKFKDIFELTEENFEEWVLEAEDPWVVLFTDGMLRKEWKTLAVSLRGIVWFGMLHRLQQEDLLYEIVSRVTLPASQI